MTDTLTDLEQTFQALGDQTRLRILALLATGEVCVCHIHESLDLPQPKVSRHLAYLRRARLVDARREGPWVHYRIASLSDPVLRTVHQAVTHALGHVAMIRKDAENLTKRQTCQPAALTAAAPGCACCEPARVAPPAAPLA
jgi:ArsR family transcriptional regulator